MAKITIIPNKAKGYYIEAIYLVDTGLTKKEAEKRKKQLDKRRDGDDVVYRIQKW